MLLLMCLLGIQCYAMEPLKSDNAAVERCQVMSSVDLEADEISRLHAKSANMTVFHMAYKLLCSYSVAGARDFLDDFVAFDPATPENGNKNIRERYDAWVARTGAVRPHMGDSYTEEDWDELRKRSDAI